MEKTPMESVTGPADSFSNASNPRRTPQSCRWGAPLSTWLSRMVKRVGFAVELSLSGTSRPARNGRNLHNLSGLVAEGKSRRSATRTTRASVS